MDDGSTSLTGSLASSGTTAGIDVLYMSANGNWTTINFIGTGLDILMADNGTGGADSFTMQVDGGTAQAWPYTAGTNVARVMKLVSGLPYGMHTVRINRVTAATWQPGINTFIIYGPKKPSIPESAIEIGEYYLVADYSFAGSVASTSTGIVRKMGSREAVYSGTWTGGTLNSDQFSGNSVYSSATNSYVEFSFWGTSIEPVWYHASGVAMNVTVSIDGSTNLSSYSTQLLQNGTGLSFNSATGVLSGTTNGTGYGNRLKISGLPLGLHKIKLLRNNANVHYIDCFDVGTPVHFPNTNMGSLAMSPGVEVKRLKLEDTVDLSKAKAWVRFDQSGGLSNNKISSSYNISSVVFAGTGLFMIYFNKPFKDANYIALVSSATGESGNYFNNRSKNCYEAFTAGSGGALGNTYSDIAFFGELEDEG